MPAYSNSNEVYEVLGVPPDQNVGLIAFDKADKEYYLKKFTATRGLWIIGVDKNQ